MRGGQCGSSRVKPLHRQHANTPTWCDPMLAQPARDWSVFKQMRADHWDPFRRAHPRSQPSYSDELVATMLACGNPEQMGSIEYRGLHWGQGQPLVALSGPSSLCWRCAKVYVDHWVSQVSKRLHAGVIYRPSLWTVPALFRTTFSQHAAVVLNALRRGGVQCLDECDSPVRGKAL